MKKTIEFGKIDYLGIGRKTCLVSINLELKEKNEKTVFTASGNVWNHIKSDIYMGGQCLDELMTFEELKNNKILKEIVRIWKLYHLNDMKAGTKEQEQAIKEWLQNGNNYNYTKACEHLKSINLYETTLEDGSKYKYGHGWLYEPISKNDLQTIYNLMDK